MSYSRRLVLYGFRQAVVAEASIVANCPSSVPCSDNRHDGMRRAGALGSTDTQAQRGLAAYLRQTDRAESNKAGGKSLRQVRTAALAPLHVALGVLLVVLGSLCRFGTHLPEQRSSVQPSA